MMWNVMHKSGTVLFTTKDKFTALNRAQHGWRVEEMNDITALAQRVERIISEMKLKHGDKDIYAPVMKWDEFLALVEALEKAQTERDELQQGFIANQEEAREAIKYAYELKEQLARACAGREEAVREVEETQKTLDHIHRRRVIWRGKAVTAEAEVATLRQRISELEFRTVTVKSVTPEVRNALKAEGLADVLKDAEEYMPLTAGQWEALARNRYHTFIRLSGAAAGIQIIEGEE